MTRATRPAQYTGAATPDLYLTFDLGIEEWKLGFTTEPGATPRTRVIPARDLDRLTGEITAAKRGYGVVAVARIRRIRRPSPRHLLRWHLVPFSFQQGPHATHPSVGRLRTEKALSRVRTASST